MTQYDAHGQPVAAFGYWRNRDKLLNNLVGILDGILADGHIDEQEVIYLDTWLKDASTLAGNWAFDSLCKQIEGVLEDGIITADELAHLQEVLPSLLRAVVEMPSVDFYSEESDKLLLEGLCKGVMANRLLNDGEVRYLDWWLGQNIQLKANFPGRELYALVQKVLADGQITEDERQALAQAIERYIGNPLEDGAADGMATRLPVDINPTLSLEGASICFTGQFLSGTRKQCQERAAMLGAAAKTNVVKDLDYLVIGTLSSRDWRFSNHGRKIEKALEYRERYQTALQILDEETWVAHLKQSGIR
ncbi:BRCT domain-containing protein [Oceanimonas smirnovii]|uniref:BRCT domain-containing protein n=1 Tax=Oceanimonas smirnovii TaxID=264574 RepID=UPI0003713DC4|nr:BRCT domain-containing protein [Oceanimonas smirnovii]